MPRPDRRPLRLTWPPCPACGTPRPIAEGTADIPPCSRCRALSRTRARTLDLVLGAVLPPLVLVAVLALVCGIFLNFAAVL